LNFTEVPISNNLSVNSTIWGLYAKFTGRDFSRYGIDFCGIV
jgi:hypothetical protein